MGQDQAMDRRHSTEEDQRLTKIASAIYTIKETVNADRGHDQPSEAIGDVREIATDEIRRVEADLFHKRSSYQSGAIEMRDGEFQGQADQLVEDCKVMKIDTLADDEIVRPPTGIDVIETGYESDRGRDRPRQAGQKSGDIEDNRYEVTDPVHKQSSRQPDRIKSEDCELQDQVDKRTKKMDCTKTDEETTKDELTPSPMYHHDAGELFAEDVDQNLAVLPEVVTPTQDITIDDIQVGDPGIPITEDQEKLRQMI
uniref:Uncharacterized protein n=1 Tax=Peronospora matthiolae TaxID=2874970 RepID=A0AAV1VNF8_9STRA